MIPEGILEKYIKVSKLAHHGVAGEATAAQRVLTTLESRYPGIRAEADVWERADMDVSHAVRVKPSGVSSGFGIAGGVVGALVGEEHDGGADGAIFGGDSMAALG